MATYRVVNTKFWDDTYVANLDPAEKLIFLYLITNSLTNISGVYEIQVKRISFDTGYSNEVVNNVLTRLERDSKVFYRDGWIAIANFIKHQVNNPSTIKGIARELGKLPRGIFNGLVQSGYSLPPDWLDEKGEITNEALQELETASHSQSGDSLGTDWSTQPKPTQPNITKPKPTDGAEAGGLGFEKEVGGGFSARSVDQHNFLILNETQLELLDKEYPELNVDDEYDLARDGCKQRNENVKNPMKYMRARLNKIRLTRKMAM